MHRIHTAHVAAHGSAVTPARPDEDEDRGDAEDERAPVDLAPVSAPAVVAAHTVNGASSAPSPAASSATGARPAAALVDFVAALS